MTADPWSMDYGMVHTGGKRDSRVWGIRQFRQLSSVQSGYRKSRTDLNLLVRCPSIRPAVWQDWHVGEFFSFMGSQRYAQTHLVSNRDSMQYACIRYGGRGVILLLPQSTQSTRTPEWAVGSFPGFCSVSSTGKAFPANDSFGIAVMV